MKKIFALALLLSVAGNVHAAGDGIPAEGGGLLSAVQGPHASTALIAAVVSGGYAALVTGADKKEVMSEAGEAAAIATGVCLGLDKWDASLLRSSDDATRWGSRAVVGVGSAVAGIYGEYHPIEENAIPAPLRALLGLG